MAYLDQTRKSFHIKVRDAYYGTEKARHVPKSSVG